MRKKVTDQNYEDSFQAIFLKDVKRLDELQL